MKRIISFILSLALIMSLFVAINVAHAEEMPGYEGIYSLDFDDLEVGEYTSTDHFASTYTNAKLISSTSAWEYVVEEHEDSEGDNYIYLAQTAESGGNSILRLNLPTNLYDAKKVRLTYDFKIDGITDNGPYMQLKTYHYTPANGGLDAWGPVLQAIYPNNGNIMATYSTATSAENAWTASSKDEANAETLSKGDWHQAEAIIDTRNARIDFYYDGEFVGAQSGSRYLSLVNSAVYMQFMIHQGHQATNGIYLDNIKLEKAVPYVEKVELVDVSGTRVECDEEADAVSKRVEIQTKNAGTAAEIGEVTLTDSEGISVIETAGFDADSGIYSIEADSYFAEGEEYTLSILGKTCTFSVQGTYSVSGLLIKRGTTVIDDIDMVTAGETLSANVEIIKTISDEVNLVLAVACYDGNNMKSFIYKNVTISETDSEDDDYFEFDVPDCENLVIKAFVIDDLISNNHLNESIVIGTNEDNEKTFKAEGSDRALADENVTIAVYAPQKSSDDLQELSEMVEVLAYYNTTTAGEDGEYSVDIRLTGDNASGLYNAYAICNGDAELVAQKQFVSATENETAINNLLLETTKEGFIGTARTNSADLGFGEFTDEVPDEAYEILYNYYMSNTIDPTDYEENIKLAKKCEKLAILNTDSSEKNIFAEDSDFIEIFPGVFDDIDEYFGESYFTEGLQKRITEDVKGVMDISDIRNTIKEQFILNLVENSNGYQNLTPVLRDFAEELGIEDEDLITNSVSKKVNGKKYPTIEDLAEAIDDILNEPPKPSSSGGGGGGGGIPAMGLPSSNSNNETPAVTTTPEIPKNIYDDVSDDHWARDAIVELTVKGIMSGNGDGKFRPNDTVTREQFTKMVVAAFCEDFSAQDVNFNDVQKDEWYYEYIAVAFKEGLISGISETEFGTGSNITRQDMAVILNRAAKKYNYNFKLPEIVNSFEDDADISDYAKDAVYTLKNAGIVNGNGNGFAPKAFATRAEAAMMIYSMISM